MTILAGVLTGCQTNCDTSPTARTASVSAATVSATTPCPRCLTQLVFIQKDFKPIADGPSGNWKTNFEQMRSACVQKSRNAHPDYQQFLFDNLQESIDVALLQGQPKMATLVAEMKACMLTKGYGLVEVQGRSSG
jgi:hypothetical protein